MNTQDKNDDPGAKIYVMPRQSDGTANDTESGERFRFSVTDAAGSCFRIMQEEVSGEEPIPWASRGYRNDALRVGPTLFLPEETEINLLHHIKGTPCAEGEPTLTQIPERGSVVFHRARACWPEEPVNKDWWPDQLEALRDHARAERLALPFASLKARNDWLAVAREIDATDLIFLISTSPILD